MATNDIQVVAVECSKVPSSESKSPWKKVEVEVVKAEASPVIGEEDWPSLLDVRRPRKAKVACIHSQVAVEVRKPEDSSQREDQCDQQAQEIKQGGGNGDSSQREEQCHQQIQEPEQGGGNGDSSQREEQCDQQIQKQEQDGGNGDSPQREEPPEQGGGNGDYSRNHEHCHQLRPRQNQNNAPLLPVSVPYPQPVVSRFPRSSIHTHVYRPMPAPLYNQRPLRVFNPTNHFGVRPSVSGRAQRPFGRLRNSVPIAYTSQPIPFAAFPGIGPVYYPPPPHGPIHPRLPPQAAVYSVPVLPPEPTTLRERIVKQIEYYFSEENLISDYYLICQMDGEGWVPITTIANFPRIKKLATNIEFILEALQTSHSVEVKGDKLRKRNNWSRYVFANDASK